MTAQTIPMSEPYVHPLRIIREKAGLTQRELAEKAEVALRCIAYLENHQDYRPRIETRRRLLHALGVPFSEHFGVFGSLARSGAK